MPKVYRAALIGTGSIADAHVRAAEDSVGRVKLVAAADINPERLKAFAEANRIEQTFADPLRLFAEVRPDLVMVATPPSTHAEVSIQAMEHGASVLCEKPLCGSLAEFDRIEEAERRHGVRTACVFQMRFASSSTHLQRMIRQGKLGRPLVGVCNTVWYRDEAYYAVPWRGRWASELGGPTMGLGIHAMDHFLHLMGDWEEVSAMAATLDRKIEVEDVSTALVRFASGALATVVNSALSPRQETYLRMDFQRATVELTHLYGYRREHWRLTVLPSAHDDGIMEAWQALPPDVGSTHSAQLRAWLQEMDQNVCPLTAGSEARKTIEFLTAIYKSAFTGERVRQGSIVPGDPFYTAMHGGRSLPQRAA